MIGVIGYLCLDLFPELGNEPFKFEREGFFPY